MDHSKHPRPLLWTKKEFHFPNDVDEKDALIHHLETFPSQCAIVLESIPNEKITLRTDDKWSIQEHLGHLLDLDDLTSKRIDDILSGKEELSSADMTNELTWDKNYNNQNIYEICERFMQRRKELVALFNTVAEEKWINRAFHKRLDRQYVNP